MTQIENPFNAFTVRTPGIVNVLHTELTVSQAFDPEKTKTEDYPEHAEVVGLWDTGATGSVISERLAQRLNLVPSGQVDILTASGPCVSNSYVVNVVLPNNVGIAGVQVSSGPLDLQGFDMLIGMDIINGGDFSVTNFEGKTCFTFRTPSCHVLDYVKVHNDWLKKNVERNSLCFCGSGKKFKKCCLNTLD